MIAALSLVLVLVVLIVAHEYGHYIAAKLSGMAVDEFGLGYPPRALVLGKRGETTYTLNWLPFGGFVKIRGEEEFGAHGGRDPRSFGAQNRFLQGIVLLAGIAMNLLLAYVLITVSLMLGSLRVLSPEEVASVPGAMLMVSRVVPDSPAAVAGIEAGDVITSAVEKMSAWNPGSDAGSALPTPESFTTFVHGSSGNTLSVAVERDGSVRSLTATPARGLIASDPSRYAIGVEVASVGMKSFAFSDAVVEGFWLTLGAVEATARGLWSFFGSLFTLSANFSQVSGPVGIAEAVGGASAQGVASLLGLMALISINLALINLVPVPALDGGRFLFVLIESITRRPIHKRVAETAHGLSFALLILLMLVITVHDIWKLVA